MAFAKLVNKLKNYSNETNRNKTNLVIQIRVHEFIRCAFVSADMADMTTSHLHLEIGLLRRSNPLVTR